MLMKVIAKKNNLLMGQNGHAYLTLDIDNYRHIDMVHELDEEKVYSVEIKEAKSKRSLAQNRYFWLLMHEIDVAMNGRPNDEEEVYAMCLELANVKFDYIGALPEAEPKLRQCFRAVKYIKDIDLNGKPGRMFKVFIGSSKMDTKEMSLLIDTALDLAERVGVETDYWKSVLK